MLTFLRPSRGHLSYFTMRDKFPCIGLPNAFLNQGGVVVVERKVLIYSFVKNEAAVTLLERSYGVESGDFLFGGAEGNSFRTHNDRRIRRITREYKRMRQLEVLAIASRRWASSRAAARRRLLRR